MQFSSLQRDALKALQWLTMGPTATGKSVVWCWVALEKAFNRLNYGPQGWTLVMDHDMEEKRGRRDLGFECHQLFTHGGFPTSGGDIKLQTKLDPRTGYTYIRMVHGSGNGFMEK